MPIIPDSKVPYSLNLTAGVVQQLSYVKNRPKVLVVRNKNSNDVYLGDSANVSSTNFLLQVVGYGTGVYTEPDGLNESFFVSSGNVSVDVTAYDATDITADQLYQTTISAITNSTTTSNVNIADGADATQGALANTYSVDETSSTKTIMAYTKGIIYLLKQLDAVLNTIDTDTGAIAVDIAALETLTTAGNALLTTIDADTSAIAVDTAAIEALLTTIDADTSAIAVDTAAIEALLTTIETNTDPSTTPVTPVVNLATANNEQSYTIPAGTKQLAVSIKGGDGSENFRIAFTSGVVASTSDSSAAFKAADNQTISIDGMNLTGKTLYIAHSAGSVYAQIIALS